jgi:hypothetical protein
MTRRIATLQGHHREVYCRIKRDPERLTNYRASTRKRVQAWRARHTKNEATHGTYVHACAKA